MQPLIEQDWFSLPCCHVHDNVTIRTKFVSGYFSITDIQQFTINAVMITITPALLTTVKNNAGLTRTAAIYAENLED